ncbi:restriction endonuclease subunit S (plasmid) [Deinococcus psychrotolerans]|uniref:Restriction endonuclease subunit S n=1 Tax=Deinococcus psychrotolerans TaxID=2489213 RepID=A0A3G8YME3_9DEIO|nr:restriction endonuclease subunit S [Deinococcus psychrotolerans]AZI45367.1 restriction endonuclease subunit S [Deinococcus psychrotolerans]
MKSIVLPLSEVGVLVQGLTYKRYVDPDAPSVRLLQVTDLDNLQPQSNTGRSEHLDLRKNRDALVRPGQVLIAMRTNDIKTAVVPAKLDNAVATNGLTVLTVDPAIADPHFMAGLLRSQAMRTYLAPLFSGQTVQGISLSKFRNVKITLPPLKRQVAYAAAFAAQDTYRNAVESVIALQTEALEMRLSTLIPVGL